MNIRIIRDKAASTEVEEMLAALESYIKLAVDINRGIVAGGGILHADCEAALLDDGSRQEDIWGADWLPGSKEVKFEALINIRPKRSNRSMVIEDGKVCQEVEKIVRERFGHEKS